jgi:hypothetical protein
MCRIQESKVKDALKRITGGKAMGLNEILIEVWGNLGGIAVRELVVLGAHGLRVLDRFGPMCGRGPTFCL